MGAGDGGVDVGVGEDDVGALAAELEGDALQRCSRVAHDELGGFSGAGEGDFVDAGMLDHRAAGGGAVAGDDVDDAVGDAGFLGEAGHAEAGEGRLLGGLHDDGAAGGEGGAPFPGHHEHGEIPGDDLADDADGFFAGVAEVVAANGDGLAVDFVGVAGVVAEAVDREREIGSFAVADGFAVVERFEGGELGGFLFDEIGEFVHEAAAVAGVHSGPFAAIELLAGGFDGEVNIGSVAFGHAGDHFFGGWVERVESFATLGGNPLTADETLGLMDAGASDFCGGGGGGGGHGEDSVFGFHVPSFRFQVGA